eukprot:TRINITY_DN11705_c0_g1::TRINITY_DN11705_c0_g1_i1::g.17496::m.17496 TRINITY_DN11705_c0_g1::TRINITY_DN11705_c0_g1_i1::g.17496  ORF type:complete len:129 (-),score=1.74 TRINITY_DN11705_c0_g1_i1:182-568(-)
MVLLVQRHRNGAKKRMARFGAHGTNRIIIERIANTASCSAPSTTSPASTSHCIVLVLIRTLHATVRAIQHTHTLHAHICAAITIMNSRMSTATRCFNIGIIAIMKFTLAILHHASNHRAPSHCCTELY